MKRVVINIFKYRKKSTTSNENKQQEFLDFLKDEKNLKKAATGSMEKRHALIKRVELKEHRA